MGRLKLCVRCVCCAAWHATTETEWRSGEERNGLASARAIHSDQCSASAATPGIRSGSSLPQLRKARHAVAYKQCRSLAVDCTAAQGYRGSRCTRDCCRSCGACWGGGGVSVHPRSGMLVLRVAGQANRASTHKLSQLSPAEVPRWANSHDSTGRLAEWRLTPATYVEQRHDHCMHAIMMALPSSAPSLGALQHRQRPHCQTEPPMASHSDHGA